MGGADADGFPADGEGPVREVYVSEFLIDVTCVANDQFAAFVDASGYVTSAERFGWSFVFGGFLTAKQDRVVLPGTVPQAPWWRAVRGATWRTPEGPGSDVADRGNHPVVHVSWRDARAYAKWARKRLPTEAEWEKAARGGLTQAQFPWGDELTPNGEQRANIWQGDFPTRNTAKDGYLGTGPVRAYAPNGIGLYNAAGNVWEWCADRWSSDWHAQELSATRRDPRGPSSGSTRVLKGGSYLCHASYCNRYRVAGRTHNEPEASTGNMGFRCAADAGQAVSPAVAPRPA
jgi:formylglycine-generating enzyme required for sulfatase activity